MDAHASSDESPQIVIPQKPRPHDRVLVQLEPSPSQSPLSPAIHSSVAEIPQIYSRA